jgi:acyl-CoA reductase-like NAD-dependent aldehyde dehydrogenase
VFFGPLARESQLGFLEHLTHHAVRRGAEVLMGGKRVQGTRGFFFEPTVIGHCNHTMEIMHRYFSSLPHLSFLLLIHCYRESFGPIVGLQKVNNDDDAVSLMNDTQYGLTAAVYGNDEERCTAMLRDLNVGTCYWNACDRVSPYLPWTGTSSSSSI